jgi:hypothetical protein
MEPGFIDIAATVKTKGNKQQRTFNLNMFPAFDKITVICERNELQ